MSEEQSGSHDTSVATDVLIIGAGPTGLMAAALLARLGVTPRIIDLSEGPAKESRAMAIQARSLELFQSMGLAEPVFDGGLIVNGIEFMVDGKPAMQIAFDDIGRVDTPYSFPLILPQSETEAVLLRDLKRLGIEVAYGTKATGLTQDDARVDVTIAQPDGGEHTISAAYVIGADGAHSMVRKALGLSFLGAAYKQDFLLADCTIHWPLSANRLRVFVRGTGLAAVFPMRGTDKARVLVVDGGTGATDAPVEQQGSRDVSLAEVEAAFRTVTGLDVTLTDGGWTSNYRVHHRGVDRYAVGRVFVAGDAAHIHSPAGGQGMNTGLQDVANLVWKLAAVLKGDAPAALLDSYHAERWPVGRKILERTDKMFAAMSTSNSIVAGLRNAALPLLGTALGHSETVRAQAFRFVSQLGIRYHVGPYILDDLSPEAPSRWKSGFRAGYRAPDGRISRTQTVFDLLGADHFTLLALSSAPLDENAIAVAATRLAAVPDHLCGIPLARHLVTRSQIGRDPRLIQAESNDVFRTYGLAADAPAGLFLVRPDGYIAYRADGLAFDRLDEFLERFGSV